MTSEMIRKWRKRMGFTQIEASKALGCGRRSLQRWEKGDAAVPKYIALACGFLDAIAEATK